ncbi:hypothetical protein ACHAXM_002162 [Skeletonema potamos]|jgi:hypothetical protein
MSILSFTATKARADCPLGFKYTYSPTAAASDIFVSAVSETGVFGGTGLKPGQQIISINGESVKKIDPMSFKALLASIPAGDVTIIVRTDEAHHSSVKFDCVCNTITRPDRPTQRTVRAKMTGNNDIMPDTLTAAGVPRDVWLLIYALIEEELMPVSLICFRANEEYSIEMQNYALKATVDKKTEKAANMKGVHLGILHNNVSLKATALKDQVNSLLARYNIMASIALKEYELPKYPEQKSSNTLMLAVGLNFYRMNFLTISAIPASAITDGNMSMTVSVSAVPVAVPSAPETP